jgi:hypothetical protein
LFVPVEVKGRQGKRCEVEVKLLLKS